METNSSQYVEPSVSQTLFDDEVRAFKNLQDDWRVKGVFLVKEEFPVVEFIFTTPTLTPAAIVFSVVIDFANYNIEAPSVKFINPFTRSTLCTTPQNSDSEIS